MLKRPDHISPAVWAIGLARSANRLLLDGKLEAALKRYRIIVANLEEATAKEDT